MHIIKTEICNIVDFGNPFLMHGFRDRTYPLLGQPAQYYLGWVLAITLAYTPEHRIAENTQTAFSLRRPTVDATPCSTMTL